MTTTPQRILIVEDEQEIRRFLRVSLGSLGYEIAPADYPFQW